MITRAPCMGGQAVLAGGRALPAQVHWGVPGGVVLVSVDLYVNEGWSDNNLYIMQEVSSYLEKLNQSGYDWIVAGDFNIEPSQVGDRRWLHGLGGVLRAPSETTCRQSMPGSCIDYFLTSANLVTRVGKPCVQEATTTFPHLPVFMPIAGKDIQLYHRELRGPRSVPRQPKPGCSRYPL